jgi:hypothetical protein
LPPGILNTAKFQPDVLLLNNLLLTSKIPLLLATVIIAEEINPALAIAIIPVTVEDATSHTETPDNNISSSSDRSTRKRHTAGENSFNLYRSIEAHPKIS